MGSVTFIKHIGKTPSRKKKEQLTVRQLIELLREQPLDALVWHEGCDCFGAADGVEYDGDDNSILITRCD